MLYEKEIIISKMMDYFRSFGYSKREASILSDYFYITELADVSSHGFQILEKEAHRKCQKSSRLLRVEKHGLSFLFDANNQSGIIGASQGMNKAISYAQRYGVGICSLRNANTFGAAFYYSFLAVQRGFIGICFSNSPANMIPIGGKEKTLGTNPISIGVPNPKGLPFLFDMATSAMAKSNFRIFEKNKLPLPPGVAFDKHGAPTTDPKAGIEGSVAPLAGFKGEGLSMSFDILAGLLSGSSYLGRVGRNTGESNLGVGQVFVAINPPIIYGENWEDAFFSYFEEFSSLSGGAPIPGNNRVTRLYSSKRTIDVPDEILAILAKKV